MEPKREKNIQKANKQNETIEYKTKSKFTLWREKHPAGLGGTIVNMRAVLR